MSNDDKEMVSPSHTGCGLHCIICGAYVRVEHDGKVCHNTEYPCSGWDRRINEFTKLYNELAKDLMDGSPGSWGKWP